MIKGLRLFAADLFLPIMTWGIMKFLTEAKTLTDGRAVLRRVQNLHEFLTGDRLVLVEITGKLIELCAVFGQNA